MAGPRACTRLGSTLLLDSTLLLPRRSWQPLARFDRLAVHRMADEQPLARRNAALHRLAVDRAPEEVERDSLALERRRRALQVDRQVRLGNDQRRRREADAPERSALRDLGADLGL